MFMKQNRSSIKLVLLYQNVIVIKLKKDFFVVIGNKF